MRTINLPLRSLTFGALALVAAGYALGAYHQAALTSTPIQSPDTTNSVAIADQPPGAIVLQWSEDGQWIEAWQHGELRAEYRPDEPVTFQEEWRIWDPATAIPAPSTPSPEPSRRFHTLQASAQENRKGFDTTSYAKGCKQ